MEAIGESLTADLLKPAWRRVADESGNPFAGHCYAAAEAAFHLLGGAAAGWVPHVVNHDRWPVGLRRGQTHWFIRNRRSGAVLDPTSGQFEVPVDYSAAKGCGFLTAAPSRRARIIMARTSERLEGRGKAARRENRTAVVA